MSEQIEQLERLAKLKDQGVLSEEEFQAQKARVLAGVASSLPSVDGPPLRPLVKTSMQTKIILSVLVGVAGVAALALSLILPNRANTPGGSSSSSATVQDAFYMCHEFVKDKLKAPATADFASYSAAESQSTSLGGNRFRVSGVVDSENSFGANIRGTYQCVLSTTNGETWKAETVTVE